MTESRQRGGSEPAGPGTAGAGRHAAPGDRVELASPALVAGLERRIAETPVVDRERVEALRAAIAEGRYEVRPERIAERLLALERLLGGGR